MKYPVIDLAPKRIQKIEFGVLSSQDTKQLAVCELSNRDLYDISQSERPPAKSGALDLRLGTASKTGNCVTCNSSIQDCVGHFGQIQLALPVFHIGFFKQILTILQNICKVTHHV